MIINSQFNGEKLYLVVNTGIKGATGGITPELTELGIQVSADAEAAGLSVIQIETKRQEVAANTQTVNTKTALVVSNTTIVVNSAAQVALDRIATSEDRTQTELDRQATNVDAIAVEQGRAETVIKAGDAAQSAIVAGQERAIAQDMADSAILAKNTAVDSKNTSIAKAGEANTSAVNAAVSEANAGNSATSANSSKVASGISEINAKTSEVNSLANKVATQLSADAALIQSGVYATEALGRAAVADGQAFKVQGTGDVAAYEYRRTDATTSVLIASYPSSTAVSGLHQLIGPSDLVTTMTNVTAQGTYFHPVVSLKKMKLNALSVNISTVGTAKIKILQPNADSTVSLVAEYPISFAALGVNTLHDGVDFNNVIVPAGCYISLFTGTGGFTARYKNRPSGSYGQVNPAGSDVLGSTNFAFVVLTTATLGVSFDMQESSVQERVASQETLTANINKDVLANKKALEGLQFIDKTNLSVFDKWKAPADQVYVEGISYNTKGTYQIFTGLSTKQFNRITIPIVRDLKGETVFTNGLIVKIMLRDIILTKEIPFSVVSAYNALTRTSAPDLFDYNLYLDYPLIINAVDLLLIGWETIAATDKIGVIYKSAAASDATEYSRNRIASSTVAGFISNLTAIPALPNSQGFYSRITVSLAQTKISIDPDIPLAISKNAEAISALTVVDPSGYVIADRINFGANIVYDAALSYATKNQLQVFTGITKKNFNCVTIPICRNLKDDLLFTDGLIVKIIVRDTVITKTIPFSVVSAYNALGRTDSADRFDYTILLDSPMVLNPGDQMLVGWECIAAGDKSGSIYKMTAVSDAYEYSRNRVYNVNTIGFITNMTAIPVINSQSFSIRISVGWASSSSLMLNDLAFCAPKKVYTVCNDLVASKKGFNRNNSVAIYLDHFLSGLTSELDAKFDSTNSDRFVFTSKILTSDSNGGTTFNEGLAVKSYDVNVNMIGSQVKKKSATIKHISTLASANKTKFPRILCLGDSITFGELADVAGSIVDADVYWLMAEQLFDQDRKDNGDIPGELKSLFVGQFVANAPAITSTGVRTRSYTYDGATRTIRASAEGRRGWKMTDYMGLTATGQGAANPFYDAGATGTVKFSIKKWLDKYKTLADDGTTRLVVGSTAGSSVTNVNSFDVCLPTHIFIALGTNDNDPVNYAANILALKNCIKAEYAAQGWAEPFIGIGLFDAPGTYFPSRHPAFGLGSAFWVSANAHTSRWQCMVNYLAANTVDNEDVNKFHLLPFFWVQPTAWSIAYRDANLPDAVTTEKRYDSRFKVDYGWVPFVHPNGLAHLNYAYQLYSWIKYTNTL